MTLNSVIGKYAGNYNKLFSPNNFLSYDGKQWKVMQKIQGTKTEYFENLASALIKENKINFSGFTEFLIKFNSEWSASYFKENQIRVSCRNDHQHTCFSSKISHTCFLSNFFPTLIVIPVTTKDGNELTKLYYSAEVAYQALKLNMMNSSANIQDVCNSSKAKKIGKAANKQDLTQMLPQEKIELMQKVVEAKFDQNPYLKKQLSETGQAKLYEATQDKFWGIGIESQDIDVDNCCLKDSYDKSNMGENHLGNILMTLRDKK
jgi:ribA/ribD-fused uncharacterized protein